MEEYAITIEEFTKQVQSIKILKNIDKHKIPSTVRHEVWKRYVSEIYRKGKCFCCRTSEIEESNFDCGHVISRNNKGPISLENLRPICGQCNRSMGTQNMDEFIIAYGFWEPKVTRIIKNSTSKKDEQLNSNRCRNEKCKNTPKTGYPWCDQCCQKERISNHKRCQHPSGECTNIVTNGFEWCDSCYKNMKPVKKDDTKDPFAKLSKLLTTSK